MTGQVRPAPRAWLMWGIPAFLFLFAFFHRAAPGVFAKELMQSFGATGALIGLLSATYFYAYAGLMIPAGVLLDRLGVRWTVSAGGLVMSAGALFMALAAGPALLFTGRFLVGAGASVMFVGALKIAAAWFPAPYFATLSATTASVGVLGGLVGTAPVAWLALGVGWRGALGAVAIVTLAGAAACLVLVRDHPPAEARSGPGPAPGWAAVVAGLGRVLRNPHTWPPFLAFFFLYSATNNLIFWIVPCLRDVYDLGMADAALYATASSLALLVAGPLTGFVSDRVLRRRRLPYTVLTGGPVRRLGRVRPHARPPAARRGLRAALRHGAGGRGVRPDVAARARGQSARARRRRGGGGEPRRVRGRRADAGAARARSSIRAGPARWPGARASTRSRRTGRPSRPRPSSSCAPAWSPSSSGRRAARTSTSTRGRRSAA